MPVFSVAFHEAFIRNCFDRLLHQFRHIDKLLTFRDNKLGTNQLFTGAPLHVLIQFIYDETVLAMRIDWDFLAINIKMIDIHAVFIERCSQLVKRRYYKHLIDAQIYGVVSLPRRYSIN